MGNTASCRNPWAGGNTGGGFQYTSGSVTASRARVLFAFARDTDVQLINGGGGLQYNNHGDDATGIFAGDHDKARMLVILARSSPFMMVANQQYHWAVIEMDSYGDVATEDHSVCQGCCQPVLITLVRVELDQEAGAPGGDVIYLTTPATRNYVWWQQNGCNGSVPVPTRKSSWGAIKATYR